MRRTTPGMTVLLAGVLGLVGCSASRNEHSFKSESHLPTTLQITDAMSGNVVWAMDVPVGDRLTVDFNRPHNVEFIKNAHEPPTSMGWKLYHIDTAWQTQPYKTGNLDLSSRVVMKVSYRPSPEYPPGYKVPGVPESEIAGVTQNASPAATKDAAKRDTLNPNQQGENTPPTTPVAETPASSEPARATETPATEMTPPATETTPGVLETTPAAPEPAPSEPAAPATPDTPPATMPTAPAPAPPAAPVDPKLDL